MGPALTGPGCTIAVRKGLRRRRDERLLELDDVEERLKPFGRRYLGVRAIPLDALVGTDSRAGSFTRDFRPLHSFSRDRMRSLEAAFGADQKRPAGGTARRRWQVITKRADVPPASGRGMAGGVSSGRRHPLAGAVWMLALTAAVAVVEVVVLVLGAVGA